MLTLEIEGGDLLALKGGDLLALEGGDLLARKLLLRVGSCSRFCRPAVVLALRHVEVPSGLSRSGCRRERRTAGRRAYRPSASQRA